MAEREALVPQAIRAGSSVSRALIVISLGVTLGCGSKADAGEMDTTFLRDTAAGEVVLDSLGRPVPIYENDEEELPDNAARDDDEREAQNDDQDRREARGDDDEPRKRGKKATKKGRGRS